MNRIITACALLTIAVARAAVIPADVEAQITKYQSTNDGTGSYQFSYETSNGLTREESGHLVNIGQDNEHMIVEGSYSYIDAEGKLIIVKYVADENGYRITAPGGVQQEPQVAYGLPPNVVATLLG